MEYDVQNGSRPHYKRLEIDILGFGNGCTKQFKVVADEPDGWPYEHSFEAYANMSTVNYRKSS